MEARILMLCQYYTTAGQFYAAIDGYRPAFRFCKYIHACGFQCVCVCVFCGQARGRRFLRVLNYVSAAEA